MKTEEVTIQKQGATLPARLLNALRQLTEECVPHPCDGFTTDDMEWRMGTAFTGDEALNAALDELQRDGLIRYAGYDEDDAIGHCYALTTDFSNRPAADVASASPAPRPASAVGPYFSGRGRALTSNPGALTPRSSAVGIKLARNGRVL